MSDRTHTRGKLAVYDDNTTLIAESNPDMAVGLALGWPSCSRIESPANAERLAACWNACEGIADPERAIPAMREALRELHAMVLGECPSLLDEDSGGSGRLDLEIRKALRLAEGGES